MTRPYPLPRYQPLINPSDRMVRRPLGPWRAALVRTLREALRPACPDLDSMAQALNQLSLLEAYQGNTAGALLICDAQIRFWQGIALMPGKAGYLNQVIQPWINVLRLERWTDKLDSSMSLYRELAPPRRHLPGTLQQRYGIALSLAELDQLTPQAGAGRLLDAVYWREYGHLLLASGSRAEIQDHLAAGLKADNRFLRLALTEMLMLYQIDCGNAGHALSVLRRMSVPGTASHWLHFKTLEMYLAGVVGDHAFSELAQTVLSAAQSEAHIEFDVHGLTLLLDIARLYAGFGLSGHELALLRKAEQVAVRVEDEVLRFDVSRRLFELVPESPCDLRERFSGSCYGLVRTRLGLLLKPAPGPDVVRAVQSLASLDFEACQAVLDATRRPDETIA